MCLEIYELDPVKFISAPRLAWQVPLNKTQVKLDLLTDIDILLIVEKGIRGGICNAVHRDAKKLTINIQRTTTKIKNCHTSNTGM